MTNFVISGCSLPTNRASNNDYYDELSNEIRTLKRELNTLVDDYNDLVKKYDDLLVMINRSQIQAPEVLPAIETLLLGSWEYYDVDSDELYTCTFYSNGFVESQYHGRGGGRFPALIPGAGDFPPNVTGYWTYLPMENLLTIDYSDSNYNVNIGPVVLYFDIDISGDVLTVTGELYWFSNTGVITTVNWSRLN